MNGIVIIGAGSTGRGHLAQQLHECGCDAFVFIDKDKALVEQLQRAGQYSVRLLSPGGSARVDTIAGFHALSRADETACIEALLRAPLVLTAVIAENLPDIAELCSKQIAARADACIYSPQDIVCCENYDRAGTYFRSLVWPKLNEAQRVYAQRWIGFPDAMISRVVPLAKDQPLRLIAEDYNEWVVRAADVKGDWQLAPIERVADLEARLERKLWIHNGGHAALAYAGWLRGHRYIHEAVQDEACASLCVQAMREAGEAILHKHKEFSRAQVGHYVDNFAARGSIAEMMDDIVRVVRDPLRKLSKGDRLCAPALYCARHGLPMSALVRAMVNVTHYHSPDDAQSMSMRASITRLGPRAFFEREVGVDSPALLDELESVAQKGGMV